mmetsp:Transcript_32819/g.50120  ORF Transcript_32819/g.50120 Transcript_32819/m.50120 type:complete len:180 (+) Transcript_32819:3034-3573(+)
MWMQCLSGVYPMEIQVLKETNEERFKEFITNMIHNQNHGRRRTLAQKLISLLKKIPNFDSLINETEVFIDAGNDNVQKFGITDDEESKMIINQARIIENSWKDSPEVLKKFIIATISGNIKMLSNLVQNYGLESKEILEMRGVECKAFCEVKTENMKSGRSIILDTTNWNPVHFATFYK